MQNTLVDNSELTLCYHCGEECDEPLHTDNKIFCCQGCMSVYQILTSNNLGSYYKLNQQPGSTLKSNKQNFDYLDNPSVISDLISFSNTKFTIITFFIPSIHCSSCIWLLENLYKLEPNILSSRVDFLKKQVTIKFDQNELTLRGLAEFIAKMGYAPLINLQDVVKEKGKTDNSPLIKKIGVAGFCFGNSMLWSFPEYIGLASFEQSFRQLFGYLNLLAGTGVFLYSSLDYFKSAYYNLKNKNLNIDFPLALGIAVLYIRSTLEIISGTGAGFFDTLCGLVFFLLIGKWMQQKTYYNLSFDRDYRSYFPIAVIAIHEGKEEPITLASLKVGDRIIIRNEEIIPADAILLKGDAKIDFSFVTGESEPEKKVLGELIYAGGRQKGESIELEIVKPVSQSYLTKLWNNEAFTKQSENKIKTFSSVVSKYFAIGLVSIAIFTWMFWAFIGHDYIKAWETFTAILIIACPCALAISTPFTMSMAINILDKNKFYLKNIESIEQLAKIDTIVFDKTGTITSPESNQAEFLGHITEEQKKWVASLVKHSSHPLSKRIYTSYKGIPTTPTTNFEEIAGQGLTATIDGRCVKMGKLSYVHPNLSINNEIARTEVHLSIDNEYLGAYIFDHKYRTNLSSIIDELKDNHEIHLLSGDKDQEKSSLQAIFGTNTPMFFNQSPLSKLEYIQLLQDKKKKVMMIGDGLNDAGALKKSDLGIAIAENVNNFTPSSDAILDASSFDKISIFQKYAKSAVKVVKASFLIAILYNILGLSYAVQGNLSPLIAAILMPISTVTIISFTSGATWLSAKYMGLTNNDLNNQKR